ncbi:MAG: GPW/gp25 family protein [Mycobacteriaceae bacterium]|nr:GPW/gp25 family protein [Mycobacteriaceae bacterium]MBV9098186.1 GPW/gp25 family protein [Frankiaceae bacterium]MBV9368820.1 GPW/gp25 family protein [Frankiales bacterium]
MDDRAPLTAASLESQRVPDVSFIGRGISWPMGVDHTGSLRMSEGPADLDRSIRVVIATAPGERVMRPEFGCRVWDMLFEPVTANLLGQMAQAVRDALAQWEPRATIEDVVVHQDDDDHALVHIGVQYVVKATNDKRNLVYPFYVIPREED